MAPMLGSQKATLSANHLSLTDKKCIYVVVHYSMLREPS